MRKPLFPVLEPNELPEYQQWLTRFKVHLDDYAGNRLQENPQIYNALRDPATRHLIAYLVERCERIEYQVNDQREMMQGLSGLIADKNAELNKLTLALAESESKRGILISEAAEQTTKIDELYSRIAEMQEHLDAAG